MCRIYTDYMGQSLFLCAFTTSSTCAGEIKLSEQGSKCYVRSVILLGAHSSVHEAV